MGACRRTKTAESGGCRGNARDGAMRRNEDHNLLKKLILERHSEQPVP
jgi:hypothetical protein